MKKLLFVLVLVALVLAGGAYYTQYRLSHSNGNGYTTAPVDFGVMRDVISATAMQKPLDTKLIMSEISGQVVAVMADPGDKVEEGQPLLQLDQRDALNKRAEAEAGLLTAEATVAHAEAKLETAKAAWEEAKIILQEIEEKPKVYGTVDKLKAKSQARLAGLEVKTAETGVELAKRNVGMAQTKLTQADLGVKLTTISVHRYEYTGDPMKKPNVGRIQFEEADHRPKRKFVVLKREVEWGQNIDAKQPLFVLAADLGEMRAHALIPESQISRVAVGQKAQFWVDALGDDKKMPATVVDKRLAPSSVGLQGAVSYEVVLNVKNVKDEKTGEWQLKSGMTAQVEITDRTHRDVWKLPVNARSFTLEDHYLTAEAKKAVADAENRLDMDKWSKIWILRDKKPWPVFVRLSGVGAHGETGIKDAEYHEILEWDAQTRPDGLNPKDPTTFPEVIIGAPPKKNGLFELPNIKL
jgi:multidrug resistance efflux pump